MGKAARRPGSAQSAGDEIKVFPAAAEAVKDALTGGMEFVNSVDRGAVMSWEAGLWGTITQNKPNTLPVPATSSRGCEASQSVAQVSAGDQTL